LRTAAKSTAPGREAHPPRPRPRPQAKAGTPQSLKISLVKGFVRTLTPQRAKFSLSIASRGKQSALRECFDHLPDRLNDRARLFQFDIVSAPHSQKKSAPARKGDQLFLLPHPWAGIVHGLRPADDRQWKIAQRSSVDGSIQIRLILQGHREIDVL